MKIQYIAGAISGILLATSPVAPAHAASVGVVADSEARGGRHRPEGAGGSDRLGNSNADDTVGLGQLQSRIGLGVDGTGSGERGEAGGRVERHVGLP